MPAKTQEVNIDLDRISRIAQIGVRRAAIFMGLGLNAAHLEDFQDYELYKIPQIKYVPSIAIEFIDRDLPKATIEKFKQEFAVWVIGCGLRELLEHYAIFLDHVHRYALLVLHSQGLLARGKDPQKLHKNFSRRLGIGGKLDELSKCFNISMKYTDEITALYEARNCLTHDIGVVSEKRVDATGKLRIKWISIDVIVKGVETGIEENIMELKGKLLKDGTRILIHDRKNERVFSVGDKLHLSHEELWGICYFIWHFCIPDVRNSFVKFLQFHNVPLREVS